MKSNWPLYVALAGGIFVGGFWAVFGLIDVLGSNPPWWRFPLALLPGAGILYLVLKARYAPLPFGGSMIALGLGILIVGLVRGFSWPLIGILAGPISLIGTVFVVGCRPQSGDKHRKTSSVAAR